MLNSLYRSPLRVRIMRICGIPKENPGQGPFRDSASDAESMREREGSGPGSAESAKKPVLTAVSGHSYNQ